MEFLAYLLIGLVTGVATTYVVFNRNKQSLQTSLNEFQKRFNELTNELQKHKTNAENLERELERLRSFYKEEVEKVETIYKKQIEHLQKTLQDEQNRLMNLQDRKSALEQEKINSENQLNELKKQLEDNKAEHLKEIEALNKKLTSEFKNIANEILAEKSKTFAEQNKNNLDLVLSPLKERIESFQKKVEDTFKADTTDRVLLKEQIENLTKLNQTVSTEAHNLVKALKGDNKTQGNWGEMLLEKILERSGLRKNVEYILQYKTQNSEEKTIRPDVIINLPDNKHLIIDSKVSLTAFEGFVNAESDEQKETFKKEHLNSLRNHIKGLSEKNYHTAMGLNTPDMVLMFIPVEPGFSLALQSDPELYNYAWDRKIVLVSPTTLLATLRTIASIWKQENQVKYALEISNMAGELYDKFVAFGDDMLKMGERLRLTQESYDSALNKLKDGRGNLVRRIEKLKDYRINANKQISDKLLDGEKD